MCPKVWASLSPLVEDMAFYLQLLAILGKQVIKARGGDTTQILVQWEGFAQDETTWEDEVGFSERYLTHNLEGKVVFESGSNDTHVVGGSHVDWTIIECMP